MKTFAFTAALLFSTAAIAQTQPAPMPPGGPDTTTAPAPDSMPPAGTTNDGMNPAPSAPAPAPSDPMQQAQPPMPQSPMPQAPMTTQSPSQPGMAPTDGATTAPTAQASYPRCSRTVMDQCRQNSARESDTRGGPRKRRSRG